MQIESDHLYLIDLRSAKQTLALLHRLRCRTVGFVASSINQFLTHGLVASLIPNLTYEQMERGGHFMCVFNPNQVEQRLAENKGGAACITLRFAR